jgi:cytochrome c peroxidase
MVERFRKTFGDGPTAANVAEAIAAYERALLTLNSPFDRYQRGEREALSPAAAQGFAEFQRLGCASCHQGLAFGGNMYERIGVMGDYFAWRGTPVTAADFGRYNVTGREEDKYKFKVPGLRNVALTQPYFHDGSAATLDQAVRTMAELQIGLPVGDVQVSQLIAFLESLTGAVDPELM